MPGLILGFLVVSAILVLLVVLFGAIGSGMAPSSLPPSRQTQDDSAAREARRMADINAAASALIAEFTVWKEEASALGTVALDAGISRHVLIKEASLLAIASLEDSVERSVIRDKPRVCRVILTRALDALGEEPYAVHAVLGRYRSVLAARRTAQSIDDAELGRIFASRSGLPKQLATELATNVHALLMRAGLARLDQLADARR